MKYHEFVENWNSLEYGNVSYDHFKAKLKTLRGKTKPNKRQKLINKQL